MLPLNNTEIGDLELLTTIYKENPTIAPPQKIDGRKAFETITHPKIAHLRSLYLAGFIVNSGDKFALTDDGSEYLRSLNRRKNLGGESTGKDQAQRDPQP
jgi:hypothetical protein